jgi:succinate dehydrogenase/fumarate reductase flavoprotein subunit
MSESLRNDGRIWVPVAAGDDRPPNKIPETERDYFLERRYPAFGNLVPRDVASRAAKGMIDEDRGVGPRRNGVYLDFADAINRLGASALMQGLADGYFILPVTIGDYLAPLLGQEPLDVGHEAFAAAEARVRERVHHYLKSEGEHSVDWFHRELGKVLWDACGDGAQRT